MIIGNVRDALKHFRDRVGRQPENEQERAAAVMAYILEQRGSLERLGLKIFGNGRIRVRPAPKKRPRKPEPHFREALLARAKKARPYEEYYG